MCMKNLSDSKERFTIYLDPEVHQILREYAFCLDIRTRNQAVVEIVTDFLIDWKNHNQ